MRPSDVSEQTTSISHLLHQPDHETPAEEICASMDKLVQSGKARYWGLSNHDAEVVSEYVEIAKAAGSAQPSVLEEYYNIAGGYSLTPDGQSRIRRMENEMFPVIRRHGLGTMFFSPVDVARMTSTHVADPGSPLEALHAEVDAVAGDLDATRAQVCIAWILDHPEASTVLAGPEHPDHVDEMLAGVDLQLPRDIQERLDDASVAFSDAIDKSGVS